MEFLKTLFWIATLLIGSFFIKRYYYAFKFKKIADLARYKWHVLDGRNKSLVLGSEWMRQLNNIKSDEFSSKDDVNKLFDVANNFLMSDDRMLICFESGILSLWESMKFSGDYDMIYAKATLDKLFINYDKNGEDFLRILDHHNNPLKKPN